MSSASEDDEKGCNQNGPNSRIRENLRAFYAEHNINVDQLATEDSNANLTHLSMRFIRINPRFDKKETLSRLQEEISSSEKKGNNKNGNVKPLPVLWLEERLGFYALPGHFSLAQSACYREGRIYGMDISSGAAVAALLSNRYDKKGKGANPTKNCYSEKSIEEKEDIRILDLCCAPGLKLCAMADYLSSISSLQTANNTLVGVDVSDSRIATCKRILHKYHISPETSGDSRNTDSPNGGQEGARIRLYCSDGTCFDRPSEKGRHLPALVFDSTAASEEVATCGKRKRMNKSAKARQRKRLRIIASMDFDISNDSDHASDSPCEKYLSPWKAKLFDYVLVDAECSTDGSLKHIQKQIAKQSAKDVAQKLTDASQLLELVQLQKNLAACGFRLLKKGGSMVYSTCSLCKDQNENVVAWLLDHFSEEAFLIPVEFSSALPQGEGPGGPQISEGMFGVRFHPNFEVHKNQSSDDEPGRNANQFLGGGFFLAKIGKRRDAEIL